VAASVSAAESRRSVASATHVLAVLLGLILSLSMVAAGSRVGIGLAVEGAALRDCVTADQASNDDGPSQPPTRLVETELQEDSEDDSDDERTEYAQVERETHELTVLAIGRVVFCERCSDAAQRVREGHGARGPPRV
jgi:hypothetical protein